MIDKRFGLGAVLSFATEVGIARDAFSHSRNTASITPLR